MSLRTPLRKSLRALWNLCTAVRRVSEVLSAHTTPSAGRLDPPVVVSIHAHDAILLYLLSCTKSQPKCAYRSSTVEDRCVFAFFALANQPTVHDRFVSWGRILSAMLPHLPSPSPLVEEDDRGHHRRFDISPCWTMSTRSRSCSVPAVYVSGRSSGHISGFDAMCRCPLSQQKNCLAVDFVMWSVVKQKRRQKRRKLELVTEIRRVPKARPRGKPRGRKNVLMPSSSRPSSPRPASTPLQIRRRKWSNKSKFGPFGSTPLLPRLFAVS